MLFRIIFSLALFILGFVLKYFEISQNAYISCFLAAFLLSGYSVIFMGVKNLANIFKGRFGAVFDENTLMSIACFGAILLGEWAEAAAIMIFYMIGEYFNEFAITRSKDAISTLLELSPQNVRVIKDDKSIEIPAKDAKIDDIIEIRAGERVALDSKIIFGESFADTSAITGESVPKRLSVGQNILAGYIILESRVKAQVTALKDDSALAKIATLVQKANANKSRHEKFISRFARVYTPVVVILAFFIALFAPLVLGQSWEVWINRALIFLVISCPCALVISVPLAFFAGIGAASKEGILVRSSQVLDTFSRTKKIIFDKTGTLTKGVFSLNSICSKSLEDSEFIAHAAHATKHSNHPVAKSLNEAHSQMDSKCEICAKNEMKSTEFSGLGMRTISAENELLAGNSKLLEKFGIASLKHAHAGSIVHLALNGDYKGHAVISDEIKASAKELILELKKAKIRCLMLTGDNEISAKAAADALEIEGFFASLLPAQKVEILERELGAGVVAFVGDGINDAAPLARADVGIAINGQDIAVEAADIVLLNPNIKALSTALKIAKRTRAIAWENIIFALGSKGAIMVFGSMGIAGIWAAIFADVGVSLLCVLNAMRAGRIKKA